jgi:hypothetical protein
MLMKKITLYGTALLALGGTLLGGCSTPEDSKPPVVPESTGTKPTVVTGTTGTTTAPQSFYKSDGLPEHVKQQYQRMGAPIK